MKNFITTAICAVMLAGCAPNTGLLVRFPIGNVNRGHKAFVTLECHGCHRIDGVELPPHPAPSPITVALGGHTPRIETYGDIATSIVNPSHRLARSYRARAASDGESPMAAEFLNDVITVQQLVDLAAFLRTEYDYIPPPPPPYWESYPGGGDARFPSFPPFDPSR
jgi:L-cysteine S-thiosulfotransferase